MYAQKASRFLAPPRLACPDCSMPMRLAAITPSMLQQPADEIFYRCEDCASEIKLVTGPIDDDLFLAPRRS
jgi:hypothetical protein